MPITMDPAVFALVSALIKSAIAEAEYWSQGRTREEILKRAEEEEAKTQNLFDRVDNPDGG